MIKALNASQESRSRQVKSKNSRPNNVTFSANEASKAPAKSDSTSYLAVGAVALATIGLGAFGYHKISTLEKGLKELTDKASANDGTAADAAKTLADKAAETAKNLETKAAEVAKNLEAQAAAAAKKLEGITAKAETTIATSTQKIETAATETELARNKAVQAASMAGQNGLSIWDKTFLDLKKGKKLTDGTIDKIHTEIDRAIRCEGKMKAYDKTHVLSVSYEGWGGMSGGQHDVANELPNALKAKGVHTTVVAPLFKMKVKGNDKAGFSLTPIQGKPNTFLYKTNSPLPGGAKEIEVTKVYDEKMTGTNDKLQVFHAKVGPEKTDVLFIHDDRLFDFKEVKAAAIYCDTNHSREKTRMAQFNNMTYELLMKMKEGKIAVDGQAIEAPNKMLAHEAWQSGGLLQKMKLYSHVEEAEQARGEKSEELGSYIRELSDNTGVIIHNIGDGYQGWQKPLEKEEPFEPMEEYYNTLYGEHARDMVKHSMSKELAGTIHQRVGFAKDWGNPAQASVVLSSEIGSVSEGYTQELVEKGLGKKLTALLKLKHERGGLVSYPNGVDKKSFAATRQNVDTINKKLESVGRTERVQHYTEIHTDQINPDDAEQVKAFATKRAANKVVHLTLLKEAVQGFKGAAKPENGPKTFPSILFNEGKFKGFHGKEEYVDLSDLDPTKNVPIYSMASRLDPQKGFDTMAEAIYIHMKELADNAKLKGQEKPIFFISGDGNDELAGKLAGVQERLHALDPELAKRVLFTKDRLSNEGLLLTNMTTTSVMPSDFEPFGISDIKGAYGGARLIVTDVGGMKASGAISRKIFGLDDDPQKANAIVIRDYDFMCIHDDDASKDAAKMKNAKKLAAALAEDTKLENENPDLAIRMCINAGNTDVSWDKQENGALGNYLTRLKINLSDKAAAEITQGMAAV